LFENHRDELHRVAHDANSLQASRLTGFEPLSGGQTHRAKVVIRAVPANVTLNPMDDPE
jgi:hypothetical protein